MKALGNIKNYSKASGKASGKPPAKLQVTLDKDDCFQDDQRSEQHLAFFENTQVLRCVKVYLDEDIKSPKYYRTLVQAAESLGEGDILHISINSYGGQLDGALAIIGAMQNSECHVQVSIDGAAASAASLIALSAPNLLISDFATMMIHAASFASFGKQSDVISHASFVDKRTKSIMQAIYKDFLTDSELQEVIMGREIWMDADEIVERLEMRKERQEQRMLEAEELQAELEEEQQREELERERQEKLQAESSSATAGKKVKTDVRKASAKGKQPSAKPASAKPASAKPAAKKPQAKPKKQA